MRHKIWQKWLAFGRFVGNFLARIFLSIFYFTVFVPFGLGARLFSDPLQVKTSRNSSWRPRITGDQTLEEVRRQF